MAASEDQNRLDRERNQDSELEQYGVWVKAGPEDVDESDAEDEMFTLTDLDETELDEAEMDLLGGDDQPEPEPAISDDAGDELSLDDDLDLGTEDELSLLDLDESASEEPPHERAQTSEPETEDDTEDLLTLEEDDLVLDLDEETEELGVDSTIDLSEPEPLAAEPMDTDELEDLDELELDDESDVASDLAESAREPTDDLDLDSIGSDQTDETAAEGGIDIDDELPGNLDDLTLDLDSLDVDAFAEPITGDQTSAEADETAETDAADALDLEIEASADEIQLGAEDLNLEEDELDLSALDLEDDTEVAELDLSTLPDDEDEFTGLAPEATSEDAEELPELELDDDLSDDVSDALSLDDTFDDVQAVEDEMTAPAEDSLAAAATDEDLEDALGEYETVDLDSLAQEPATAAPDDSQATSLLASIERELSSIRSELSDLKHELSTLRSEPRPAYETSDVDAETDESASGGFFEDEGDDDDETIALTGDELDNIMNTAEFTEETGQPTDFDDLALQQAATAANEQSADSHPVQEITLEEAPEEADEIDLDLTGGGEQAGDDMEADVFGGTEDDVEALAELDIDAELADIEELDDHSTPAESEGSVDRSGEADDGFDLSSEDDDIPDLELDDDALGFDGTDQPAEEPGDALEPDDEFAALHEPEPEPEPLDLDDEPTLPAETPVDLGDQMEQLDQIGDSPIPENIKGELRSVLNYMDKLLDSLPEEKIQEFAASEHFKVYQRLFEELGLEQ